MGSPLVLLLSVLCFAAGVNCLPTPYSEMRIAPKMRAFKKGDTAGYTLDYNRNCALDIAKLKSRGYLSTWRVVFIVHGFQNDLGEAWMNQIKDAMLKVDPRITVIQVGWGQGSKVWYYPLAASNIQTVGNWLGKRVARIRQEARNVACIWGIGHSLGAHVLGMAGKTSNRGITRITGLDPAGPEFERVNQGLRLSSTDATKMVDVIHTDGYASRFRPPTWVSPLNHYGTLIPLGTLDFYPNYGYQQPGTDFQRGGSHGRAIDLFCWSILNRSSFVTNKMLARAPEFEKPVSATQDVPYSVKMGYYADQTSSRRGNFYVKTTSRPPWE